MIYVKINHLSDDQLELLGYVKVHESKDFILYQHARTGEEHIVEKAGDRFIFVDDLNDAIAMRSSSIVQIGK